MTVQRHDRPYPHLERTFTAVRAVLPAANVAAFDAEFEAITHAPVAGLAALDDFLSGWWRIATRAAADPAGWQRMHQEAEVLRLAPGNGRELGPAGNMHVWDYKDISVTYVLSGSQREVAVLRVDRFPI